MKTIKMCGQNLSKFCRKMYQKSSILHKQICQVFLLSIFEFPKENTHKPGPLGACGGGIVGAVTPFMIEALLTGGISSET